MAWKSYGEFVETIIHQSGLVERKENRGVSVWLKPQDCIRGYCI